MQAVQLGLRASRGDRPHVAAAVRPDLHPARQLGPAGRVHRPGRGLPHARRTWPPRTASPSPRTMVITTMLFAVVARERFGWSLPAVAAFAAASSCRSSSRSSARTSSRSPQGGWFPLVAGAIVFTMLTTWHTGRQLVRQRIARGETPLKRYLRQLFASGGPARVDGTAVYLFGDPGSAPPAMVRNLRHHRVLHGRVVVVSVVVDEDRARVAPARPRGREVPGPRRDHRRAAATGSWRSRTSRSGSRRATPTPSIADFDERDLLPGLRGRHPHRDPGHGRSGVSTSSRWCSATPRRRPTGSAFRTSQVVIVGVPVEI